MTSIERRVRGCGRRFELVLVGAGVREVGWRCGAKLLILKADLTRASHAHAGCGVAWLAPAGLSPNQSSASTVDQFARQFKVLYSAKQRGPANSYLYTRPLLLIRVGTWQLHAS
jgi:hypothetical protein